jgi:phosphoribosyl-ATP pyrophosphohydrolase/phosphoribosyl-AMP cyclohydrolase
MDEQGDGGRRGPVDEKPGSRPIPIYDERGLIPTIVQDAFTREVLTLAYVNEESLRRTVETGETWFWSRSRQALWHKGETSNHTQRVVSLTLDCDDDALLVIVEPAGPACHTGQTSCFHHPLPGGCDESEAVGSRTTTASGFGPVVEELYSLIETRRREMPEGSYTTYLFEQGLNKILKKVGEESAETIIAAKDGDPAALTSEISDLIYHLVVLMVERGQSLEAVAAELRGRSAGRSGR